MQAEKTGTAGLNLQGLRHALLQVESERKEKRKLSALETRIVEEFKRRKRDAFGDEAVIILPTDPRYAIVLQQIEDLVKDYPTSPRGSRFIGSKVTVKVFLYVNISHFNVTYKRSPDPRNLFLEPVGKEIDFGPLKLDQFGAFTKRNITLKVQNLHQVPGEKFKKNKHADRAPVDPNAIALGGKTYAGDFSTDPALMKTKFLADVQFGTLLNAKRMTVTVETLGEEESTYVVIPLDKLTTTSKIPVDGSFTVASGATVHIEDLEGDDQTWIDCKQSYPIRFPL